MDSLIERATPAIRQRGAVILLALVALATLRPSPVPYELRASLASAQIALQSGDTEAASAALARALELEPNMPEVRRQAVELALSAGDGEQALALIDDSTRASPDQRGCWLARARLLTGPPGSALRAANGAPAGCPLPLDALDQLAEQALASGDVASAVQLQELRVRRQPDSAEALAAYGRALALADPTSALEPLRQALELDPRLEPINGALVLAIEDARGAKDPAYSRAQVGQAYARHGLWQPAKLAFSAALDLNPDYIEAQAYYGVTLDRLGQDGGPQLQAAADAAPGAAVPAALLGLHWLERNEPQRALAPLARAASLSPENPAYAAQHAAALAANGDLQGALAEYQRATELAPDDSQFWRLLTDFCLANELDAGGDCLRAARRTYLLDPSAASASDLGYAHFLAGNLGVAGRLLRQSVTLDPTFAEAHFRLGLLGLAEGEAEAARAELQLAQQLDPDGRIGQLAQRALERGAP